ncbi:DUF58 domain-containing protein [Cohnella suwonensis]|uniref:DUF58 domain-containing protein n=1 Tax=Cohnella suwonensis TaxID=696072 RepID=A0ABW0LNV9_9BACL
MTYVFWIVLLMSALYGAQRLTFRLAGLKSVAYDRSFSQSRVHAGESTWMRETIANGRRLPLPWVRVESQLPAQLVFKNAQADMSIHSGDRLQNHASLFTIPGYTEIVRKHEIVCPARGKFRIDSYTLTSGDIVGFPGRSVRQPASLEIVVYPRLKRIDDFPLEVRRYVQSVRSMISPIREDAMYVAGIRPYRPGDSFRMVNWSATAKTGQLLVHRRESMQDNDLTLILNAELLDRANNARMTAESFEEAVSYAASAAQYIIGGGGKAGLIFNGEVDGYDAPVFRAPERSGAAHMDALLEAMAGFKPETRLGLSFLLKQLLGERQRGKHYLLVTAFIDSQERQLVRELREQGNGVELLLFVEGGIAS